MSESREFFVKHRFAKTVGLILAVIAFDHIWVYYVLMGLVLGVGPYGQLTCTPPDHTLLEAVVLGPLIEEMVFRVLPTMIAFRLYLKGGIYRTVFWIWTFVISCLLFGYIHGGWSFVITVGIGGLAYAWLCVKVMLLYGDLYHEEGKLMWTSTRRSVTAAYLSCFIVHAVFNSIVTIIMFVTCPETTIFTFF